MTIYDSAPGKTYRLIYLTGSGATDAKTITLRTDNGQTVVIDRAQILDDREVSS